MLTVILTSVDAKQRVIDYGKQNSGAGELIPL